MKSKILLCVILASCSTMQVSEDKVKDRYTDVVKSTEIKDDINIKRDDVYVCDYRYDDNKKKNIYFRYCDKDGKPLNNTIELERQKYELRDGYIYYVESETLNGVKTQTLATSSNTIDYIQKELRIFSSNGKLVNDRYLSDDLLNSVGRIFCDDGKIISEKIEGDFYSVDIYNEVKKDGVELNAPLIIETINKSELDEKTGKEIDENNVHLVNGRRVLDGSFEIADCNGDITSYTIKNGKYEGDWIYDTPYVSEIKKYENGELKSEVHIFKEDKIKFHAGYYNKLETIIDKDNYKFRYYLDDKLVYEN